jgi:hypothetical protein
VSDNTVEKWGELSHVSVQVTGQTHADRVPSEKILISSSRDQTGCDLPDMLWLPAAHHPAVKWPGREADHPCPYSVDVTNEWIYTSTSLPYSWHCA